MAVNPCSVPRALRLLVPAETPAEQAVCQAHDEAYAAGGTRRDRALADARFLLGLLEQGMEVDRAHRYHVAVRMFGHAPWGPYTEAPAPPTRYLAPTEAP